MSRTRVFTKMVGSDAKYQPAVRIVFKGKDQSDYFSLKKIAEDDFDVTQTALGRLIICDWLRNYRDIKKAGHSAKAQQMVMILKGEKKPAGSAGKKGASPEGAKNDN